MHQQRPLHTIHIRPVIYGAIMHIIHDMLSSLQSGLQNTEVLIAAYMKQ